MIESNLWHKNTKNKFKYRTEKNGFFIPIIYRIITSKYSWNAEEGEVIIAHYLFLLST